MTEKEIDQIIQTLNNSFIALQNVGITATEHNLDMMKLAQNNIKGIVGFLKEKEDDIEKSKKIDDKNK